MNDKHKTKLWAGRFKQSTHDLVDQFNASITFDQRLAKVDIIGSLAHAAMLAYCNIVPEPEVKQILNGLQTLLNKLHAQQLSFRVADEDIHMNIEQMLFAEIGEIAGKLHTGRSRNDQVATDTHLYLREELLCIVNHIHTLQTVIIKQAGQHIDTLLPGYTHLQRAQPVRLAHHLLAYVAMLQRDTERLMDSWPRINTLPLGCGALAGNSFPIDREYLAELLGFEQLYQNSMDAVSDRDFVIEFIANCSIMMMHLSRLSEELILWSSQEFAFIELGDAFCTGSSMLPHKKNPDIPELVRGKSGRVYGALMNLLTVFKALPLTYNKDMQEDKEALFDTVDTVKQSLQIYAALIEQAQFQQDAMHKAVGDDYSGAIAIADYLSKKNVPFRQAHHIAGQLVMHCLDHELSLSQLPLQTYQQFHPAFEQSLYSALQAEAIVDSCKQIGGTGKQAVQQQLHFLQNKLNELQQWYKQKQQFTSTKLAHLLSSSELHR